MQSISTIGLDIAKSVFQVHGVDAVGQVVLRRQLKRRINKLMISIEPPKLTPEDEKKLADAYRAAQDAK